MRSVETWAGATDDARVPNRVRLRVFEAFGGRCALSGRKIMAGEKWELDHRIALANGGRHDEANLQPVLAAEHKLKTRADVAIKSKVARVRAKHLGLKPASPRGFYRPPGFSFDWSSGRYTRDVDHD